MKHAATQQPFGSFLQKCTNRASAVTTSAIGKKGLVQGCDRAGTRLVQGWCRAGTGLAQGWCRAGTGLVQGWYRAGTGLARGWCKAGTGLVQGGYRAGTLRLLCVLAVRVSGKLQIELIRWSKLVN